MIAMMENYQHRIDSWGYIVSFSTSIFTQTLVLSFLLWLRFWLRRQNLTNEVTVSRFGGIYEGFKPSKEALVVQEWFVIRRIIFAATAFYLMDHSGLAQAILYLSSLATFAQVLRGQHSDRAGLIGEIFNETFMMLLQYHLICFSDFIKEATMRVNIGFSCALVTFLAIIFNLVLNSLLFVIALKMFCKRKLAQCRAKWRQNELYHSKRYSQSNLIELKCRQNPNNSKIKLLRPNAISIVGKEN